jgi:hypothetical protein
MKSFIEFLETLLGEGRAVLQERPEPSPIPDPEALKLLESAFDSYRLQIAGPVIDFSAEAALSAADTVWNASWFLVSRQETEDEVASALARLGAPKAPSDHLSADLTLRYLPTLHRRARAREPADRLTTCLETILRNWPLTGVLSEIQDEPLQSIEFGGHPGLLMLYAERLSLHEKPAWFPTESGRPFVELVWQERGRDPATIPSPLPDS